MLDRLIDEQTALLRLSRVAVAGEDLASILTELARASLSVAAADECTISLWDVQRDRVTILASISAVGGPVAYPAGERHALADWPIARAVLTRRKPIRFAVDDPNLTARERALLGQTETLCGVIAPLIVGENCFGVIVLRSHTAARFADEAVRAAEELAGQAALAIVNDRLVTALRANADVQATLRRVSRAATSNLDLRAMIEEIAAASVGLAGAEAVSVILWNREINELELFSLHQAADWPTMMAVGEKMPLSRFPRLETPLFERTPLLVRIDEVSPQEQAFWRTYGLEVMMLLPLIVGDEATGVLVLSARDRYAITIQDLAVALDVAGTIALAIENARLVTSLRRRAEEQEILLRISQTVISGRDLTAMLTEVARASLGIEGVDGCSIELWHADTDETETLAVQHSDSNLPELIPGARWSLAEWPGTRRALETRRPLNQLCPADPADPSWLGDYADFNIRSVLMIPLLIDDACLGVLELSSERPVRFTADAERFGLELAAHAAQAIRRWQMQRLLLARAETDGLTGLLNRTTVIEALEAELARRERTGGVCGVIIVDLDGFKAVNDRHGHLFGDRVLQEVARQLVATVRGIDRVGRLGGDEFLLVLPETDAAGIGEVAARIEATLGAGRITVEARSVPLGLSLGIAVSPDDGDTIAALIGAADGRMYQMKETRPHRAALLRELRKPDVSVPPTD